MGCTHLDVEVVGTTTVAVQRQRPSTDDHEVHAFVGQRDEQLDEIVTQRDHAWR